MCDIIYECFLKQFQALSMWWFGFGEKFNCNVEKSKRANFE
jgi:hypothetical protein